MAVNRRRAGRTGWQPVRVAAQARHWHRGEAQSGASGRQAVSTAPPLSKARRAVSISATPPDSTR